MSTFDFLVQLKQSGVKVWLEDERLRCTGPEQIVTAEVRQQLSERKSEIIAFLRSAGNSVSCSSSVVPIQPEGSRTPFFAVPGHNGDVFCYVDLARHLGTDQPLYALQAPGLEPGQTPLATIEEIAAVFVRDVRATQPEGPYLLGGYCVGGTIAFELARQLTSRGQQVSLLVLFASPCPTSYDLRHRSQAAVHNLAGRVVRHSSALAQSAPTGWAAYLRGRAAEWRADRERERQDPMRMRLGDVTVEAFKGYRPQSGDFPIYLLLPNDQPESLISDRPLDWSLFVNNFSVALGPPHGDTNTMMIDPQVSLFSRLLDEKFGEVMPVLRKTYVRR